MQTCASERPDGRNEEHIQPLAWLLQRLTPVHTYPPHASTMSHEAEAGPSSRPASPSPLSYLDDSPNFDSSLRMYSRLHSQTIERVREEHEREYRGGGGSRGPLSNRTPAHDDDIDYGDHPSPPDVLSSSDEGDSESQWSITTSQFEREQEEQWKEAMDQLQLAVQIIICPLLGKYMGRRWAYWGAYEREREIGHQNHTRRRHAFSRYTRSPALPCAQRSHGINYTAGYHSNSLASAGCPIRSFPAGSSPPGVSCPAAQPSCSNSEQTVH